MDYKRLVQLILFTALILAVTASLLGFSNVGESPLNFSLEDVNGETFTLSDYRGKKVVLIEFMTTTCRWCELMNRELGKIYEKFKGKIEIVEISLDLDEGMITEARKYVEEKGIHWRLLLGGQILAEKYQVYEVPMVVIFDLNGKVAYRRAGYVKAEDLIEVMNKVLSGSK